MQKLGYMVETLAPVCFAERSGDNVLYETRNFISGSSLIGALANSYIRQKNLQEAHKDAVFRELFLSGKVRFLPAYPCTSGGAQSVPLPLSVMLHKDGKSLMDYAADGNFKPGYKKLSGFAVVDAGEKTVRMLTPKVQFEFHMSRASANERLSASSIEGNVFNYEYLEPFQYFAGSIILDDDCTKDAQNALKKLLAGEIGLGKSRSAQYGSCKLQYKEEGSAAAPKLKDDKIYLYAYSAYIPAQAWSRADELAEQLADRLNEMLANAGSGARLLKDNISVFAAAEALDGYVGVWGVKRERKITLARGSIFGFAAENLDEAAVKLLQTRLYQGFGERAAEGFGQFRIWQPLATSAGQKWQKQTAASEKQAKPGLAAVQADALAIVASRIIQEIRLQAKADASQTKILDKGKGTLKRLEILADSDKTKEEIQRDVAEFRKTAKSNLFNMLIKGMRLSHSLLEQENCKQPYADIDWLKKIGLDKNQAAKLQKDLGFKDLPLTEDEIFKEYWLWFARHGVKNMKETEKNAGFNVADAVSSKGGEEHRYE